MRVGLVRGSLGALALVCLLAAPAAASDDVEGDRARCAASYENAQVLRRDEHLEAARTQLLICQQTCPGPLVRDCTRWLREVDALLPTVRLVARDPDGNPITSVRVTADDRPLTVPADGRVAIEPGSHVFRFERSGFAQAEARADLHAGERDRAIAVVLAPAPSAPPPSAPRSPAASYVLGGLGAAALVAAGVLAIKGDLDRASLRSSCAPHCDPSQVDAIRTTWWAAAGVGAAGAVALGVGIALWPRGGDDRSAATPTVTIAARAVALTWDLP